MSQVKIDFLVTGNLSSLHKQVQTLNAELMSVAGTMTAVDRSMSNIDLQAANAQFGRMMTTSGQFSQQMVTMKTHTDMFADSLARQRLTLGQAYNETKRYVTRREGLITAMARQQVRMQNSIVMPQGVGADGKVTARVLTPTGLDKSFSTQMRVANKSWEIFNATAQQGATQMVNWGKNTQWAGRQLMVGFTVPLMMAGGLAAKTFKELDTELVRLQKVYGSGFSFGEDFKKQSEMIRESAMTMARDMAQAYGQAGTETAGLMADLAATGFEGQDLMRMTEQTTKLATLGEVDRQEAMKATVALQSAFKMSTEEVSESVLFLNAVENQTSASLQDLVEAIPRAGTVVEGLGGSVEDLALYMVAMREGGISAAEGANALKSGLSSIIAPAPAAVEFMKEFGINLPKMVQQNAGELTPTLMAFQKELKGLDDLARQQVITKLFGKYQFARMNAFFNNLGAQGSQTQKVFDLMGTSMEDLGKLADQEIAAKADSVSGKWDRAWESFKINISEIGETMLMLGTQALNIFNKVFGFISDHPALLDLVKYLGLAAAAIGPVIMVMGLFGNMIGMILKGVLRLANGFKVLASGGGIAKTFEMLTAESFQADSAVDQLTGSMYNQTTAQEVLTRAVQEYTLALQGLQSQSVATNTALTATQSAMIPGIMGELGSAQPRKDTRGWILGAKTHNQGAARDVNWSPADLAKLEATQRAKMGMVFALAENKEMAKSWMPEGQQTFTGMQAMVKEAVRTGSTDGLNQFIANAQRDPRFRMMWARELEASRANPMAYSQSLVAREMPLNKVWASGDDAHAKKALNLLAVNADSTATALTDLKFSSLFTGETLDLMASGNMDYAADLEHLSLSSMSLEETMLLLTQIEKDLGYSLEDQKRTLIQMAAAQKGVTLTTEQLDVILKSGADDVANVTAAMAALNTKIRDWTASLVAADGATDLTPKTITALNDAIIGATADFNSIELRRVQTATAAYVGAIDTATGKVIAGTAMTLGPRGGVVATDAADAIQALENATDDQIMTSEKLSRQQEVAAAATEQDTAAQRAHTGSTEVDTAANMTEAGASDASAAADWREKQASDAAAAADSREAAAGMGGAAGSTGGFMNYVKNNKSMMAGGALMGGAMMGSMLLPEGPASNIANMTMMGAGVGGMFGPWGLAIGGAAGLVGGGLMEIFKDAREESERQASEAAAAWESNFSEIEISGDIADMLKLGQGDSPVKLDLEYTGRDTVSKDGQFSSAVTEGFGPTIDEIKAMSDDFTSATEVMDMLDKLYSTQVALGKDPEQMLEVVKEILNQSGREELTLDLVGELTDINTEKKAEDRLTALFDESANKGMAVAFSANNNLMGEINNQNLTRGDSILNDMSSEILDEYVKAGELHGYSYAESVNVAIQTGIIEGVPEGLDAYRKGAKSIVDDITGQFDQDFGNLMLPNSTPNGPLTTDLEGSFNQVSDEAVSGFFDNMQTNREAILDFLNRNEEDQNAILEGLEKVGTEEASKVRGMLTLAQSDFKAFSTEIYAEYPALESYAAQIRTTNGDLGERKVLLRALAAAERDWNRERRATEFEDAFASTVMGYADDSLQKTNIAQLERQNEKELEALRESEDDKLEALQDAEDARLEAMQDAAEKRENAIQKEINQTERQYDKEIQAIQDAEDKRQEAFENEQERAQRRQEMRNMEISYQEAIANGDLFEAARIRMDIAATKKQRETETKEEKRQEKAANKIKRLEREKNQKIRILNQELRAEQRANEKAIEAAQEASEAKIEAAQEASEKAIEAAEKAANKEIKAAEQANKKIENQQADTNATLAKMREALLRGDSVAFKKHAKELGISGKEASSAITELVSEQFAYLGPKILNSLKSSIASGNWAKLDDMMKMALEGASPKKIQEMFDYQAWKKEYRDGGNPAVEGTTGMATGGFVSGPGSGTSDSIPARLSNGEYVVKASKVQRYGKSFFDRLNHGHNVGVPSGGLGYAGGGMVSPIVQYGFLKPVGDMLSKVVGGAASSAASVDQFGGMKGAPSGDIVMWDGEPIDKLVAAQLRIAGKLFGSRLAVYQGSYQPQTSYSGTTHTDGGVIDTSGTGGVYGKDVIALQKAGFAAWYRGPGAPGAASGYGAHIHAISLFSKNLDTNAAYQRSHYLNMTGDGVGGSYYGPHVAPMAGLRGKLPGLRVGGRINYDNTIANLHRGETVLTKSLTDKFENNVANAGGNEYNFDVTIENLSSDVDLERAFEKFVVKHERTQRVKAGRGRRV